MPEEDHIDRIGAAGAALHGDHGAAGGLGIKRTRVHRRALAGGTDKDFARNARVGRDQQNH